jgi:polyisoprenoid-binding protein YceI
MTRSLFLLLLGVFCSPLGHAATYNLSERNGKKQITFESKAPVEYVDGTVSRIEGQVEVDTSRPDLGLKGAVNVPVDSMETGLPKRDEHLHGPDWLNAATYPTIRFVLDTLSANDVKKKSKDTWFVNAVGLFTMKGISKRINVPMTLEIKKVGADEKLSLQGRFSLALADFNVRGPAAVRMVGVRVGEKVDVSIKLVGVRDKGWGQLRR